MYYTADVTTQKSDGHGSAATAAAKSVQKWTDPAFEENVFRALVELSPDFVAVLDPSGAFKYVSPAISRVAGFTPEEVVGRSLGDLLHPEDVTRALQDYRRVLDTGKPCESTLRFRHKDGSWLGLETSCGAYVDTPEIGEVLMSTRDVTQHIEWERALRETVIEVEDLYENAACGYHSVDANGTITRINNTELGWLQYTSEEVVGKMKIVDLMSARSQKIFAECLPLVKDRGFVHDVEVELVRKDGTILNILGSSTAIRDSDGQFLNSRSCLFDITERKRAEGALNQVNRALRVLSACNQELIRAEDLSQLLHAICQVVVEVGGYVMAWVGLAERDERKSVRPVAQTGFEDRYLECADITWADDDDQGRGPTGTAIRTGEIQVINNILTDPRMAPWRACALKHGYLSAIALPLKGKSGVFGALTMYASEAHAFDAGEAELLRELAEDLAFGVDTLQTRLEHRQAQEALKRLAYFDSLTGLANRIQFLERVQKAIGEARLANHHLALLALRLNNYADLQAGLGVNATDELLKALALRLTQELGPIQLARIGDEAFALLLSAGDAGDARLLAQAILEVLTEPFPVAGVSVDIQMCIGAAVFPGHGTEADVLLLRSQLAARQAFAAGEGFALYKGLTDAERPRRLMLIGELRRAIENDQLLLHYQPKIDIQRGRVVGVEALVRWQHPERGMVMAGEFIPLAEQTGLVKPLTYRVIDAALSQAFAWTQAGRDIPIAVNIPAAILRDPEFLGRVLELLEISGVKPELLQIEITESAMIDDPSRAYLVIEQLRNRGHRIFIDDFGTGYSSLSYLANLPIDALKIDRSFIVEMKASPRVLNVVKATVSLAHDLDIKVVAEGVESIEQVQELMRLHCDEIQGYYFSRPIPANEIESWLSSFAMETFGLSASNVA